MRPGRRLGVVVALVLAILAAGLAGCGVPTDDEPRAISPDRIPDPFSASSAPPTTNDRGERTIVVYFGDGERLLSVSRAVDGDPDVTSDAMDELLAGPTQQEQQQRRLATAIPPGTTLVAAPALREGVLRVDLSQSISLIERPASLTAYAQMSYTLLALPGVTRVRFLIEGQPVDAPTDEGDVAVVDAASYDPPLRPTD